MATAIRVQAAVEESHHPGVAEHSLTLDVVGPMRLRVLVEAVLRAELASSQDRAEHGELLRVLTAGSQAAVGEPGAAPISDVASADDLHPDDAVAAALLAHEEGLYRVRVDDAPVGNLDQRVVVGDGTRLLFVRLVALPGD